jgi:hypothetical protein
MIIPQYGMEMRERAPTIACHAPEESVLWRAGSTVRAMVYAYLEDGTLFLRQGDPVNALASFGYAQGWLEGGIFLGLVSASPLPPLSHIDDTLDAVLLPHLREKVHRYHRLLAEGITAVEPASDEGSILWRGAGDILEQARSALRRGEQQCLQGNFLEALRWFGYGHGWLDVGARTGLFRITGRRDLFTV